MPTTNWIYTFVRLPGSLLRLRAGSVSYGVRSDWFIAVKQQAIYTCGIISNRLLSQLFRGLQFVIVLFGTICCFPRKARAIWNDIFYKVPVVSTVFHAILLLSTAFHNILASAILSLPRLLIHIGTNTSLPESSMQFHKVLTGFWSIPHISTRFWRIPVPSDVSYLSTLLTSHCQ